MVGLEALTLWGLTLLLLAIAVDLVIGDPPGIPHPVVAIGKVVAAYERLWNRGSARARRCNGYILTAMVVIGVYLIAWVGLSILSRLHPGLGLVAALWLLSTTLSIKGLAEAARAVAEPLGRGDLVASRLALSRIVGRDTAHLDEGEITRGAVETVAENTVDGITAPLFWALIGGAPLALAFKAVNTLDSMVGYRNARYADFGYASARLDDLANWLPARLTALSLWLGALVLPGMRLRGAIVSTCREAPRHASPNAGWPEAMVARLLGVRLGGTNLYAGQVSRRATLGDPIEPLCVGHIALAIRLMHGGWLIFLLMLLPLVLVKEWLT